MHDHGVRFALTAEYEHRDVVELRRLAGELLYPAQHDLDGVAGAAVRSDQQVLAHPVIAEFLVVWIGRLRYPVGVEDQLAVRRDLRLAVIVGQPIEHRQRHAAGERQQLRLSGSDQHRRVVAAVGVAQGAVATVENPVENGYEDILAGSVGERVVDPFQALARSVLHKARGGADHGARDRHEQRCGHPLADHVADDDADAMLVERKEVVEIAAHFPGGKHGGMNVRALGIEAVAGQERSLYAGGDLQVVLQRQICGLRAQRLLQFRHQLAQAFLLHPDAIGHFLERLPHHLQVAGDLDLGLHLRLLARPRVGGCLDLRQFLEDVLPLFRFERGRQARHFAADEPFLLALAAGGAAPMAAQGERLVAKRVDRLGDARQFVVAVLAADLDGGLRIAAGQRVEHLHAVGQRRQRPAQVVGQPGQRYQQEAADRQERDQAHLPLSGVRRAHVAYGHHAGNQIAHLRFQREGGEREHAVVDAQYLIVALAQPRLGAHGIPYHRVGTRQQPPAPVHDQGLGPGICLQIA